MQWIPIHLDSEPPLEKPFLLSDGTLDIWVGYTAFDFYDAKYWFPIPAYPIAPPVITNDAWVANAPI